LDDDFVFEYFRTALGDWCRFGPGYEGGALIFAACIGVVALLYFLTKASRSVLFWLHLC